MSGALTPMTLEGLNAKLDANLRHPRAMWQPLKPSCRAWRVPPNTRRRYVATIEAFMSRMACPSQHPSAPQLSMITHPPATVGPPLPPPTSSHRPISASAPAPTGLPLYLIANSIIHPLINDGAGIHDGNVSFTDPVVHRPHAYATTAALRRRLLRELGWHSGIDGAAPGGGTLPPSALTRTTPHLQAEAPSRPSNLAAAHGEEGDCTGECLQGVCGGVAASCGAWPPSAPADARGSLGVGRPWHMGMRPRPIERPSGTALARCLQARAWCVSHGRQTPTLRQRR
jgi:hypothetical protein